MTTVVNYAFGTVAVVLGAAVFIALLGLAVTLLAWAIHLWICIFKGWRP